MQTPVPVRHFILRTVRPPVAARSSDHRDNVIKPWKRIALFKVFEGTDLVVHFRLSIRLPAGGLFLIEQLAADQPAKPVSAPLAFVVESALIASRKLSVTL